MYILSTGCQWASLPKDLPPRSTVNGYIRRWDYEGTRDRMHHTLYVKCWELAARQASPTVAIIDSHGSVRGAGGILDFVRTRDEAVIRSVELRWSCDASPESLEDPMTGDRLPLAELLAKAGDSGFHRSVAEAVMQMMIEADVEGQIGAWRHERSATRTTCRNGYHDRTLDTRLDSLQLRIPKLRQGFPRPALPGAAADDREGAGGGNPGGLDQRRLDTTGGRPSTTLALCG